MADSESRRCAKCGRSLLLFVVVIGGIYGGIFTPTEAAAVGTAGALFFAGLARRHALGRDAGMHLRHGRGHAE